MGSLDKLESEIFALKSTIEKIDRDFKDALIDPSFYYRRRTSLIRDNEEMLKNLEKILEGNDASEVAAVVKKVRDGATDDEIGAELEAAAKSGENKSWGKIIQESLKKHSPSIIGLVTSVAVKVAKSLIA